MKQHVLLNTVIDSTDQIYGYMRKRIWKTSEELVFNLHDTKVIGQLDGLECSHSGHIEQCYEYFLTRIQVGIDYFIKKVDHTDVNIRVAFRKYLFNYFLKSLVRDFNRKITRAAKRGRRKTDLLKCLNINNHNLTNLEIEIVELYIGSDQNQLQVSKSLNTSRSTVNRIIKKIESM